MPGFSIQVENELKGMFHALLALFNECVPLSTTSIVVSSASFVLIPLLHVANVSIQLNCWSFVI
jgi:hypothetical protein